jgi:hypothetical protein
MPARVERADGVNPVGQVLLAVDEVVEELVDAHDDRQDRKADPQREERGDVI